MKIDDITPVMEEEEAPPDAAPSSRGRRIWQRANPWQGSSRLALLAMTVLYDAGEPLTRDEIADRLIPRLDAYQRGYLEAWYQRLTNNHRIDVAKHEGRSLIVNSTPLTISPIPLERIVRRWLVTIFCPRATKGTTLERLPDGRYQPGKTAPRVVTLDGKKLAYTPEERYKLEQAEADAGRLHLVDVEFARVIKALAIATPEARFQFLSLLIREVGLHVPKRQKQPIDERKATPQLAHLFTLADRATIKRHVIQRAFDALLADLHDSP
jgi:hypothetical protein